MSLDAIASNVEQLNRSIRDARLMLVVKANAYGHGLVPIAETAIRSGAEWLGVYTVEEGVLLRKSGISAPILVFGMFTASEAQLIADHSLTATITDVQSGELLQRVAGDRIVAVHVKVDTGLTRAGVPASAAVELVHTLARLPSLNLEGIFTHFACADEADKSSVWEQMNVFHDIVNRLQREGLAFALHHAANSAATLDLPDTHLDMVRVGIAAYGYRPGAHSNADIHLRPALSLLSAVTRVAEVAPGTGVGYGHTYRARDRTRIALVPIGYGDGLPRNFGEGRGSVMVGGHFVPIVGRISMDQITIDVTSQPGVRVFDPVVIIGEQGSARQGADDIANRVGTISYEVLTRLLPRVPRIYSRGDKIVHSVAYATQ